MMKFIKSLICVYLILVSTSVFPDLADDFRNNSLQIDRHKYCLNICSRQLDRENFNNIPGAGDRHNQCYIGCMNGGSQETKKDRGSQDLSNDALLKELRIITEENARFLDRLKCKDIAKNESEIFKCVIERRKKREEEAREIEKKIEEEKKAQERINGIIFLVLLVLVAFYGLRRYQAKMASIDRGSDSNLN